MTTFAGPLTIQCSCGRQLAVPVLPYTVASFDEAGHVHAVCPVDHAWLAEHFRTEHDPKER